MGYLYTNSLLESIKALGYDIKSQVHIGDVTPDRLEFTFSIPYKDELTFKIEVEEILSVINQIQEKNRWQEVAAEKQERLREFKDSLVASHSG